MLQTTHIILEAEAETKPMTAAKTEQPVLVLMKTKAVDSEAAADPLILGETGTNVQY